MQTTYIVISGKHSVIIYVWTGLLLQDMINHMVDKKNNKSTYNVWMYSAHDLTVACVLNTLRVFEPHCPPYASAVMLELRVDTAGQHNVAVSLVYGKK